MIVTSAKSRIAGGLTSVRHVHIATQRHGNRTGADKLCQGSKAALARGVIAVGTGER